VTTLIDSTIDSTIPPGAYSCPMITGSYGSNTVANHAITLPGVPGARPLVSYQQPIDIFIKKNSFSEPGEKSIGNWGCRFLYTPHSHTGSIFW